MVVLAAAALGLSACTSAGGTPTGAAHPPAGSPHDVLVASVTRTGTTSAHMTLSITISGTPSLGLGTGSSSSTAHALNGTLSAAGDFDFATKSGEMTMTVPPIAGSQGATLEIRVVDQTIYLKVPELSSATGGKPWVKLDLSSYESALGSSGSSNPLGGATSGDPTQLLQVLNQVGAHVTEVGPATIDGVPTTEYQATLDLSKAMGAGGSSSSSSSALGSQLSQGLAQALGLGNIPVSVWVDNDGRARRMTMNMSIFGIHLDMAMDLSKFGEAVTVTPPPADQVADGSSLLQGGQLNSILKSVTNISG
jgi:hypothetical protein